MKWGLLAIIACAIAVGVLVWRGQALTKRATQLYPPIGQFVEIDGVRLHYTDQGSGQAIVLIHGASGNLRDFAFDLAPELAKSHRVIAFDRPGLGYSERATPAYDNIWTSQAESPQEQAALLIAATRALGVKQPIVVGHSFGGAVA
ncbi:MAG: alpha/beta fold hydrolase, partial [Pseudomonadota bacterium]